MYDEELLTRFSLWKHEKTDSLCVVLGLAVCSTNGERDKTECSVVYWSNTNQELRYREMSEFLDGRFTPL